MRRSGTVHVLTLHAGDGAPMHVICDSHSEAAALLARLRAKGGADLVGAIDEKPATWSCDGRDGCLVDA